MDKQWSRTEDYTSVIGGTYGLCAYFTLGMLAHMKKKYTFLT